jgi:flagellar protein FlaF
MGFSTSAATAIIFAGIVLMMGVVADVVFDTYSDLKDAALSVSDSEYDRQRTRIAIVNSSYNGTSVFINASNTGEVSLTTDHIDLLLNGTIMTESITNSQVAGTSSGVWGVHETLFIEVSYTGANNWTRIRLITGNGVSGSKLMR